MSVKELRSFCVGNLPDAMAITKLFGFLIFKGAKDMKRILFALSMLLMLSVAPVNAIDFYCEPEDNNAVSYSSYFYQSDDIPATYIKLAPKSHEDEYWVRLMVISIRDKILNTISFNIDGSEYVIKSSKPDFDTNAVASVSLTHALAEHGLFTNIRFFRLSPEIVSKFRTAKKVYMVYSTYKVLNQVAPLNKEQLDALEYEQYPEYWKPGDEGGK